MSHAEYSQVCARACEARCIITHEAGVVLGYMRQCLSRTCQNHSIVCSVFQGFFTDKQLNLGSILQGAEEEIIYVEHLLIELTSLIMLMN